MAVRKIIRIDEEKCDGCGQCADACAEGAIRIVDGKARLVSDSYCDGLGACIGDCPRGALTLEDREAPEFDEEAVRAHRAGGATGDGADHPGGARREPGPGGAGGPLPCGCPGTAVRDLRRPAGRPSNPAREPLAQSSPCATLNREPEETLANWPVQLRLVPVNAPTLRRARLLVAADCTAFATPEFHRALLPGRICLVGCPKLDDAAAYREKLAALIRENDIPSIDVAYMEVPCCMGLVRLVEGAVEDARVPVSLNLIRIGIDGSIQERRSVEFRFVAG